MEKLEHLFISGPRKTDSLNFNSRFFFKAQQIQFTPSFLISQNEICTLKNEIREMDVPRIELSGKGLGSFFLYADRVFIEINILKAYIPVRPNHPYIGF